MPRWVIGGILIPIEYGAPKIPPAALAKRFEWVNKYEIGENGEPTGVINPPNVGDIVTIKFDANGSERFFGMYEGRLPEGAAGTTGRPALLYGFGSQSAVPKLLARGLVARKGNNIPTEIETLLINERGYAKSPSGYLYPKFTIAGLVTPEVMVAMHDAEDGA